MRGCDGAVVDSGEKPGLGDSTASPTGTPFTLPPGLELDEQPRGYSFYGDERCPDIDEALVHGSGGLVTLSAFPSATRRATRSSSCFRRG